MAEKIRTIGGFLERGLRAEKKRKARLMRGKPASQLDWAEADMKRLIEINAYIKAIARRQRKAKQKRLSGNKRVPETAGRGRECSCRKEAPPGKKAFQKSRQ